jgi:plastocyanin
MRPLRRTLPAFVALLVLAGCADAADNGASAPQSPGTTESAATVGGVQHLTVDAGDDLRYAQTDLHAHTGIVAITFVVTGVDEHDLTFADGPMGGTSEIADSSTTITLHFNTPGVYHFLCTVHPRMRGTLTVS